MSFPKTWLLVFFSFGFLLFFNSFYNISLLGKIAQDAEPTEINKNKSEPSLFLFDLFEKTNDIIEFFTNNSNEINADGLFGIRIAQGAFNQLYPQINESRADASLVRVLEEFKNRLDGLAQQAYQSVVENEPEYAAKFDFFISRPYLSKFVHETSIADLVRVGHINEGDEHDTSFDEPFSDSCYSSVINGGPKCSVDSSCLEYFSDRHASGYFLTHQLLFLMIADNVNCDEQIFLDLLSHLIQNQESKKDLAAIIKSDPTRTDYKYILSEYFCSRIWREVEQADQQFSSKGKLPHGIDLFIEQVLLCALTNTKEFKSNRYLGLIFLFQNHFGCFGDNHEFESNNLVRLLKKKYMSNLEEIEEYLWLLKERRRKIHHHHRSKREDKTMINGCSSHTTGLAIAYYSTLIRTNLEKHVEYF